MVPGVRIYVFKHHVLRVVSMYDLCALMCRVFHRCFRIMYVCFPSLGSFGVYFISSAATKASPPLLISQVVLV